jgi:hypothetical protein
VLLFALFARGAFAADSCPVLAPDDIPSPATHVVLFNGMWTTFADARADMNALRANYGSTGPKGQNLRYALLYHHSYTPETRAYLIDEFGALLAHEQDGVLEGRFEFLFSALHCGGPWWDYVIDAMPGFETLLERDFAHAVHTATASVMEDVINETPEMKEYACARDQLLDWADSDLVFVGHSVGDLFARALRVSMEETHRQGAIASLHIAPATVPPAGEPYLLADIDFVINGIVGALDDASFNVPEPNIEAVTNTWQLGECLGHDLSDVYLTDFELNRAVHDALDAIVGTMP